MVTHGSPPSELIPGSDLLWSRAGAGYRSGVRAGPLSIARMTRSVPPRSAPESV